jgi:hypothetical protein
VSVTGPGSDGSLAQTTNSSYFVAEFPLEAMHSSIVRRVRAIGLLLIAAESQTNVLFVYSAGYIVLLVFPFDLPHDFGLPTNFAAAGGCTNAN